MKPFLLVALVAIIAVTAASAQTSDNPKEIVLDFETKKFMDYNSGSLDKKDTTKKSKWLKRGDFYQIRICYLNMNLYNVSIAKKDTTITTGIVFPTFDLIGFDAINKVISSIVPSTEAAQKISNYDKIVPENLSYFHEGAKPASKTAKKLDSLYKQPKNTGDIISDKITITKGTLSSQLEEAKKLIKKADFLLLSMNAQIVFYYSALPTGSSRYVKDPNLKFDTLINRSDSIRKGMEDIKKDISMLEADYKKFQSNSAYAETYKKDNIKKAHEDLLAGFARAKENLDTALAKIGYDKISEFQKAIVYLENNSGSEYVSLPLQLTGDMSELTLTITPKDPKSGLQTYSTMYKFPQRHLYVGVGASFYRANFTNETYSIREEQIEKDSSHFFIVNENAPRGEVGFAALLHVGGKVHGDWLGLHGTIGPALSLAARPQPRLAAGGGVSLGKERNMLSIDLLWMTGNVDKRSNVYSENTSYSKRPEQVTVSKLGSAFSIAIGYIYKF